MVDDDSLSRNEKCFGLPNVVVLDGEVTELDIMALNDGESNSSRRTSFGLG